MTTIDVTRDQRTPEWHAARLGRLTGSRAKDMLAVIKSGEAAARRDYRLQLVCERLTQRSAEDGYTNADMQRGIELEPQARDAYERFTGQLVAPVGFLASVEHLAGCSPDGKIGDRGLVELKCPKSSTHLRYLRTGGVPSEHVAQLRHNLWVTGADWIDFVSYDDRFPDPIQLMVVRLSAADAQLADYEAQALRFLAEVETEYQALLTEMATLRSRVA